MPRMPKNKEHYMEMYEAVSRLKDAEECFAFFSDLCSPAEMAAMEQRFEVARMLQDGKVYTDISQKTHASSATISRVNRVLLEGTGVLEREVENLKNN